MNELKEYCERLRLFGTEDEKAKFKPIYLYIKKLEADNLRLKKLLDEYMAPQLFKKKDKTALEQAKLDAMQRNMDMNTGKPDEPHKGESLRLRLKRMIKENKTDTDEWRRTLKWNRLDYDEAFKLAGEEID